MYNASLWSSKVLIPLWTIQILLQFLNILSLSALMALETGTLNAVPSSDIVLTICLILTLLANPAEMVLESLHYLEPSLYLSSQVCKMMFAIALTATEAYRYFTLKNRRLFPLSEAAGFVWMLIINAGFGVVLMFAFSASLAYGVTIVRRNHKDRAFEDEKHRMSYDDSHSPA